MEPRYFNVKEIILSRNVECAYVWLTKEEDTGMFCCYIYDAEIYERNALTKHLAASRFETGMIRLNKDQCMPLQNEEIMENPQASMADRLLQEVKQILVKRDFPNSTFLAVCALKTETF